MRNARHQLTAKMVREAQHGEAPWRIGNRVLCDLCRRNPHHVHDAAIIAKVLLIGRVYSARSVLKCGPRSWRTKLQNDLRTDGPTQ
jgi:hypothetical protein